MPPLTPGLYRLVFPDLRFEANPDRVAGHLMIVHRYTVPAVSRWSKRFSQPLLGGENPGSLLFHRDYTGLGYVYVEFSGAGEVSFQRSQLTFFPGEIRSRSTEVDRAPIEDGGLLDDGRIALGINRPTLEQGHYRVCFEMAGSTFATLFQRRPPAVAIAAYTGPLETQAQRDALQVQARSWFIQDREILRTTGDPRYIRPLIESIQPPWWLSVPFVGKRFFELEFYLTETRNVWLLLKYEGDVDLRVENVVLYKETLDHSP